MNNSSIQQPDSDGVGGSSCFSYVPMAAPPMFDRRQMLEPTRPDFVQIENPDSSCSQPSKVEALFFGALKPLHECLAGDGGKAAIVKPMHLSGTQAPVSRVVNGIAPITHGPNLRPSDEIRLEAIAQKP